MTCSFETKESSPKYFGGFKFPLKFLRKVGDGGIMLEKATTTKKRFKSDLNSIARVKYKSQEHESSPKNIKLLYKAREKVVNFFMIILQLYLRLHMHHFKEKKSKY